MHIDRHQMKRPTNWNMCCEDHKIGSGIEMDGREKATLDNVVRGSLYVEVVFQLSLTGRQKARPGVRGVGPTIPSTREHVQRSWDKEERLEHKELKTRVKSEEKHNRRLAV